MSYIRSRLATKIAALTSMVVCLSLLISGGYSYYSLMSNVEKNLGERLLAMAKTASLLIPSELHKKVESDYLDHNPNATKTPHFKKLQSILRKIQKTNGLKTDVYTMIHASWTKKHHATFIGMSSKNPYLGNGLPMHSDAKQTFYHGIPAHTHLYEDSEGNWISAFAPIKDASGKVVAVLELDYSADGEVWMARKELIYSIGLPGLLSLLFAVFLGLVFGKGVAKPIGYLATSADSIAKGNFNVQVKSDKTQEVDTLANAFNKMVTELREQRRQIQDYSKNLEKKVEERTAELREKDKVVFHTSKLASIGQLASGVAHEINNPLQILQGYLDWYQTDQESGTSGLDQKEFIKTTTESVERIKTIVNGLRVYARNDARDSDEKFDAHEVLQSCYDLLYYMYKAKSIELKLDMKAEQKVLLGNKGKFQQAIMNILGNAKDAMESAEEGTITIATGDKDDSLSIKISDTGHGIPQENLEQIFEQFYTTKEVGKGTGLGLGIVNAIVENMSGKIDVDSAVNVGTCFTLDFPSQDEQAKKVEKTTNKPSKRSTLTGSVLVVDDEEGIRMLLEKQLEFFGFTVVTAESGAQAIEILSENYFDLVITDMQMPQMNGEELVLNIHDTCIDIPIILLTGEVGNSASQNEDWKKYVTAIIEKPTNHEILYDTIKKTIASEKAA